MKDLSFFLFKNSLAAKMKKSFTNSCSNDGSTSTLNQHKVNSLGGDRRDFSCMVGTPTSLNTDGGPSKETQPTLEEMILQLELEEEMAKKAKLNEYSIGGRMSCVNNSDILRSARNALNQYPRFSLDGKDAMYRSSFRNNLDGIGGATSTCVNGRKSSSAAALRRSCDGVRSDSHVVWCKPGVVAKLMGLEAMPVPMRTRSKLVCGDLKRRAERHEMKRRIAREMTSCNGHRRVTSSCSKNNNGYCVMNSVAVEAANNNIVGGGWPTRGFR